MLDFCQRCAGLGTQGHRAASVPHLPSLRVLQSTPPTQLSGKVQRFLHHWAGSLTLTRWDWVTGMETKDASCRRLPKLSAACHLWSQENIELGYTRTVNPDVQPVEKIGNEETADLFQPKGSGRGNVRGSCSTLAAALTVLRNVNKRHISWLLLHCPLMIQEQSHL